MIAGSERVFAQSANAEAAGRTRPFLANQDRLSERFPNETREPAERLIGLLAPEIEQLRKRKGRRLVKRDAEAIHLLVFGVMHRHIARGTRPTRSETDHLVAFCLNGLSARASSSV